MIRNVEGLIKAAEKLPTKEEQIKYIMNFLYRTVKYDYAKMIAAGFMATGIEEVKAKLEVEKNPFEAVGGTPVVFVQKPSAGTSKMFEKIMEIRDENAGNFEGFSDSLRKFLSQELESRMENSEIVEEAVAELIGKIIPAITKKEEISTKKGTTVFNRDISMILVDYMLRADANFPMEMENGLLKKGVCKEYTEYITQIFSRLGIESLCLEGTSELKHAWNLVKVGDEYKVIDLTRAIFIRDKYKGIPNDQSPANWLFTDLQTMFEMQPSRKITAINGIPLPKEITSENYDVAEFLKVIAEFDSDAVGEKNKKLRELIRVEFEKGFSDGDKELKPTKKKNSVEFDGE